MTDGSSDRNPVEELAEEYLERMRRGEQPALSEYTAAHPDLAAEIRDLFPALKLLEHVRPPTVEATQPPVPSTIADGKKLERLGDFRILREVGRGGMGIVYEAEQESLGRHVALKVLPAQALLDHRQLQRFQREARAAARLHHTNIVPVFGVGEHDGLQYYVMQFIPGQGLDQVLNELLRLRQGSRQPTAPREPAPDEESASVARALLTGVFAAPRVARDTARQEPGAQADVAFSVSLSSGSTSSNASAGSGARLPGQVEHKTLSDSGQPYWQSVARIGMQVAEALAYAHGQGTLHRDIKPSNLLLDSQGVVWVADFGLAKASDSENLTHTGDLVGTLRYMAPERFQGRADARSDVYALGLTLYELLTLRPAFNESDRSRLLHQVMHEEPIRPRRLNRAVPPDLETIVLKAIARDPDRRYPSAAALAEDLKRFVEDRPIRARRVSQLEILWRWCRHNPSLAAALAAVGLTVAVAFVWITHEKNTAQDLATQNAQLASDERKSREEMQKLAEQNGELAAKERKARAQEAEAFKARTEAFEARDYAARGARAVNDYLINDMLASADPYTNRGQNLTVREVLDRAAAGVERRFAGKPELEEPVREALGRAYVTVGQPQKALVQFTVRVALCRRLHGEIDPHTLAARAHRVTILVLCFDFPAIREESASLLPLVKKEFGADHPVTVQLEEDTARSWRNLGRGLEALPLQQAVVAVRQRDFPNQTATLVSIGELVTNLVEVGRAEDGLRLSEEHLATCRRLLGADHLTTLNMRIHRVRALMALARLEEAEKECQEVLPLVREAAGPDHFDTLLLTNNLACVHMMRQRPSDACRLFEECLPALRKRLGAENAQMLTADVCHACALAATRRETEAGELFDRLLPALRRSAEPTDAVMLLALAQYGLLLQKQAKWSKAEPLWRAVVAGRRKTLKAGHWLIGDAENMLGVSLIGMGRLADAETQLLAAHALLSAARDPAAPPTTIGFSAHLLGILYDKWNKPDQASAWRARMGVKPGP
jgi:serine/threonine protein kinase